MYYSSGNYEAFARPKKPEGVDNKSAYIVGSGLAALTAACYLVRDGQMKGEHVHVLEKGDLPNAFAMPWPIVPAPITPTFIVSTSKLCCCGAVGAGARIRPRGVGDAAPYKIVVEFSYS